MTTGSTAQANVHIINYVEKLLDDRHFSVRLNANFLCHLGGKKQKKKGSEIASDEEKHKKLFICKMRRRAPNDAVDAIVLIGTQTI